MELRDVRNLLAPDCDAVYLHSRASALGWMNYLKRCWQAINDTPRVIAEMVRSWVLARSGAERVLIGSRMFDAARAMVLASFPS